MARSFSQFLLAAAVAAVVGGSALAQTSLQDAVTLLRVNKVAEATTKLREILAADPSNADALALYKSVSQDEWYLLMTSKGEIGQIAQSLLDRAKVDQKARSRDEAAIAALVATATAKDSDYGTRQAAINKLVADHGEFAVPALLEKLGGADDDEGQVQAINTLGQLRGAAVLPLLEALQSSNELAVRNAAAALHHIGDKRALSAMAHLANDSRPSISAVASKFIAKHGGGSAVDLMLAQALDYLRGNVPAGAFSEVVWSLREDKLVATDVSSMLYASELAKSLAATAVRIAPTSVEARSMLAQANLQQANLIETAIAMGDEKAKAMEPVAAELKIAAFSTGTDALRAALDSGVKNNLSSVALGAIAALGAAELANATEQSSLLAALESGDKRVRYAAAEALVRASGGAGVPQAERVVAVLAEAVTEQKVSTIEVIAPTLEVEAAVASVGRVGGFALDASTTAIGGMQKLLTNPNVDVVVINEILPDRLPEDIIGNIKKDSRMANTKVVIVAKDEEAAKARFGDGVGVIKAPLTGENLIEAVNKALEGVSNPSNTRAEAYAAQASSALLSMAAGKGAIGGAMASLGLQLNRGDSVAVPAAKALGHAGGAAELASLAAALGGSGSVDLKKACADSMGHILGRLGSCPDEVATALLGALDGNTDVGLRTSIAIAIGKGNFDAAKKAELLKKLNRVAATPAGGEG